MERARRLCGDLAAPGPDNDDLSQCGEVVSESISVPADAFEIIRDQRLKPILPDDKARRTRNLALFWRSGLTMAYHREQFDALRTYFEASRHVRRAARRTNRWLARSVEFEFGNNADDALSRQCHAPIEDVLARQGDGISDLKYLMNLSQKACNASSASQFSAALGLSVGFSSLDGD